MITALAFMASALAICTYAEFLDCDCADCVDETFIRIQRGEWLG